MKGRVLKTHEFRAKPEPRSGVGGAKFMGFQHPPFQKAGSTAPADPISGFFFGTQQTQNRYHEISAPLRVFILIVFIVFSEYKYKLKWGV